MIRSISPVKNDILVITVIIVITIVSFVMIKGKNNSEQYFVEVQYDGEVVDYFQLTDELDTTIEYRFKGYNKLQVKDGYINVIEADCPDKIDVLMAPINKDSWNRTIVCAPNRLVIRIIGGESKIDGIV